MSEYKRLTKRNANGEVRTVKTPKSSYIQEVYEEWDEINRELKLRRAELEDEIENGILVPKYSVVESGNTYCACMVDTSKLLVIDEYETKAEAEKRLDEIRNETKSIDNSEN